MRAAHLRLGDALHEFGAGQTFDVGDFVDNALHLVEASEQLRVEIGCVVTADDFSVLPLLRGVEDYIGGDVSGLRVVGDREAHFVAPIFESFARYYGKGDGRHNILVLEVRIFGNFSAIFRKQNAYFGNFSAIISPSKVRVRARNHTR